MRALAMLVVIAQASLTPAYAVVLCAKPRGNGTFSTTIKIRETCSPRETALDPIALSLQGPPGPAAMIRDNNGAVVGIPFERTTKGFHVFATVAGTPVTLAVADSGYILANGPTVLFESSDCSGDALMGVDDGDVALYRPTTASCPGSPFATCTTGTLYITGPNRGVHTVNSQMFPQEAPNCVFAGGTVMTDGRCCRPIAGGDTGTYNDASQVPLESLGFVPPFRAEAP